ncbi:MAG: hypothetical protein U5N86_06555 [Planctomycetota bacterium]|nr:hypothetical protein [Planctomycetota bacterium]
MAFAAPCCAESSISPSRTTEPDKTQPESTLLAARLDALDAALTERDAETASSVLAFLLLVRNRGATELIGKEFLENLEQAEIRCAELSPKIAQNANEAVVLFNSLVAPLLADGVTKDQLLAAKLRASQRVRYICQSAWSFDRIGEALRRAAARAMMFYEPGIAADIARAWLGEDNAALQAEGARMCAELELAKLAPKLQRRADDEDLPLDLRLEYAFASHRLGGSGIQKIRNTFLSSEAIVALRFRCLAMLEFAGRDAAANTLLQLLEQENANPNMVARTILTLGKWGVAELALRLDSYLKSGTVRVRLAAVEATGLLNTSRLTSRIALIIERGDDPRLEAAAILALSRMGAKEYVPLIGKRLYSPEFEVRLEAALALQKLEEQDFGLERAMDTTLQQNIIQKVRVWWQKRSAQTP